MAERTIHDGLVNRRSVRDFQDKAVPEEVLREIVRDAQWTPSWANAQPWKVYIATGAAAKDIRNAYTEGRGGRYDLEIPSLRGESWGDPERVNMSTWGRQLQQFLSPEGYKFSTSQQNLGSMQNLVGFWIPHIQRTA